MGVVSKGAQARPSWLHPTKRFRSYIRMCSVKSAFIVYSLAAVASAVVLSCLIAGITSSLYAEATFSQTRYSGVYVYDKDTNSLIPADTLTWYFPGTNDATGGSSSASDSVSVTIGGASVSSGDEEPQSIYVERADAGSEYFPIIHLDAPPDGFDLMAVDDMDADVWENGVPVEGSAAAPIDPKTLTFAGLPHYDEVTNGARGGVDSVEPLLAADDSDRDPLVSRVGYYVYIAEGTWADAFVWFTVVAIPLVCIACFIVAGRAFYRAKIDAPVQAMEDAARRIASGDLDFSLSVDEGGELGKLAESFETMRAELERAEHAAWRSAENRRRANAAFAHDLRTPLTVLSGRAEMLAEFAPQDALDAAQVADAAQAMLRQTTRLQSYVESMRDVDALESYEPRAVKVLIASWFVRETQDARDIVSSSDIAFDAQHGELPEYLLFDVEATSRILQNLVSNAARHAKGHVAVAVDWEDGMLRLRVEDDGDGFSSEALEHAKQPYWREGAGRGFGDDDVAHFGLGLNICAVLCEKLGGSLELSNRDSGGAAVSASLCAQLPGIEE